ncbi:MAG: CoA transferase [Dehalococcoidia bacterium]|nr:CoA transferase [Dehalococcoidia bacterium]
MSERPLDGVKVVSFEHALAGPMTTEILGSYGAEVIRVETGTRLDWHRQAGPFVGNISLPNRSACYLFVNSSKRAITLNLSLPKGVEIAKRIVKWADVVVENFAGGVMAKMGLGYDDLCKVKPDIIMLSAAIYGQTGPFAHVKGHGGPLTALTGFPHITGFPGQEPQFPGFVLTDFIAPRASVIAIVAALDYRRRTGKGQYLDASQLESAIHLLTPMILEYVANGREPVGIGNRCNYAAPHGVYRCAGDNRWCAIAVFTDSEWQAFCKVLSDLTWPKEPRFQTLAGRLKHQDELDFLVEQWTSTKTAEEVMEMLQKAGVPAGVVQTGADLDRDPQLNYRGFYHRFDHPDGIGSFTYSGMPARMSRTNYRITRAPMLGEDNEYVYTKLLEMSDEEFVELLSGGIFE